MNEKVKIERPPFAMVSKFIFDYCTDANAIKLYLGLYTWADSDGYCFPAFDTIQERLKMSRGTISKSINKLKECGLLRVEKGEKRGNLKAKNLYYLNTNLPKKFHSSKNELRDSPSLKNELDPSSNFDNSLVQKIDYNENQLTKIKSNKIEKAKPSSASERKKFFKYLKGKNQEQVQYLGKIMREFKEKNPTKFPDEFLKYFYETMIREDEFGITKFEDSFSQKDQFGLENRLVNWFKVWNSQKDSDMRGLSFQEQDRLRTQENLRKIREFKESTQYNLIEG